MEFTIQDKIDIYHVILGAIEADVETDDFISGTYNNAVCRELGKAMTFYGLHKDLDQWGNMRYLNDMFKSHVFQEWYKFEPEQKSNPSYPWWWPKNRQGDHQRCLHIRKVLRSLYKQLP